VFRDAAASGGRIRGIRAPGGATLSRKTIGGLEETAREHGGKGLVWLKAGEEGETTGPAAKFLSPSEKATLRERLGAGAGDLLLLAADRASVVSAALAAVRVRLGRELDLVPANEWRPLFVVEFPLVEWNEEEERLDPAHHPFTSPLPEDVDLLETDPASVRSRAYDLVLNGVELGSGSIRIHREDLQERVFRAIGIDAAEARRKFGFLLEAFRYGPPPHGGFAVGFDRLVAMLLSRESIREVIPFPKTTSAACPLTGAPSEVSAEQLGELGLALGGAEEEADPD
jgi:aspartyl-tRNA synthetase